MTENYIVQAARAFYARRREKLSSIPDSNAAQERQARIRAVCNEILGPRPEAIPLNVKRVNVLEREGYSVELITYQNLPGVVTTANLYLPKDRQSSYPGVICFTGQNPEGKAHAECQRLGQLLARRKMAALVFDQVGQGERLEFFDPVLNRTWVGKTVAAEHAQLGGVMILTGHHLGNWALWDAVRGLDVLTQYGKADPKRLALTCFETGNILSRLLCCLDDRIRAAVAVVDNLDAESLGTNDVEQDLPGAIANGVSTLDLFAAFSPRPLMLAYGGQVKAEERLLDDLTELTHIYAVQNAIGNIIAFKPENNMDAGKQLRGRAADFLSRAFKMGEQRVREPETPPETIEMLSCTETGQVSTALNSLTMFEYHRQISRDLPPARTAPQTERDAIEMQDEIRAKMIPFLRLPEPMFAIKSEVESRSSDWGFQVEKGRLMVDEGLYVPYSFYALPNASTRGAVPTVLAVHERGVAGISSQGAWMQSFAASGTHVLTIDVPGIGETRLSGRDAPDAYELLLCGQEALWTRRALNVGLNLFGLRVFSVLRSLTFMRTRWEVDIARTSVIGVGRGGLWALYAAAIDRDVSSITLLRTLSSYKSLIENPRHDHHFSLYLPGCLQAYDLPHLAALIAPRKLMLLNSVDHSRRRCDINELRREYAFTAAMFKALNRPEQFSMVQTDTAAETSSAIIKA